MKKCEKLLSVLLAVVLLVGAVPAYAANADTTTGLNGASGNAKTFDYSKYDATVDLTYMVGSSVRGTTVTYYAEEDFEWPDGQVILVKVTGSAWTKDVLDYISVPDGKTVDVYKFDTSLTDGSGTYTLWAHYGASAGTNSASTTSSNRSAEGLNGASGKWSEFDHSVYDLELPASQVRGNIYKDWPSSGTVLIYNQTVDASYSIAKFNGVVIPAGLVVDIYKYDFSDNNAYGNYRDAYTLLGHFDTTDGKAYTIGTATTNVTDSAGSTSNTSSGTAASETPTTTTSGTSSTPTVYTHSYSDVNPGDWYYDAIMTMTEGGLLAGYPDGSFGPNDPVTSGQFSLILCRLQKSPNTEYWEKAVSLPSNQVPMTRGKATQYLVGNLRTVDTATKKYYWHALTDDEYELAVKTHAYVTPRVDKDNTVKYVMHKREYEFWKNSLNTGINYHASLDEFPDGDAIWQFCCDNPHHLDGGTVEEEQEYVADLILQAWNYGIFRGDANGNFNAAGVLTRAQLCQVLYNMGWTEAGDLY